MRSTCVPIELHGGILIVRKTRSTKMEQTKNLIVHPSHIMTEREIIRNNLNFCNNCSL